jgi:hypothetical protein
MSVRPLTIQEMLDLPFGAEAVLINNAGHPHLEVGTPLTRGNPVASSDDRDSVSFSYTYGDASTYDYFDEFHVGVQEVTKHIPIIKPSKEQVERPAEELGMYRPELGTRKLGKVRVELVDDGFPLALREVAKVMTWAQTAKGYKDHDWQNLDNPEIALAAAASRHRSDYIMQRVVEGLPALECVDPESNLVHKAHEAFGVLSQLELLLRGKFVDSRSQVGV